jgi:glycosyltransferase involved in cell wall biosynthesis
MRRGVDARLTLIGDGELRGPIERAIKQAGLGARVELTGWLDEAQVRRALAGSHALVLPSFAEGLPMVIMEAMVSARPVISTWVAGIPELVQDGRTGWLVPAGDVESLVEAVTELATTGPDALTKMGTIGRARVLTRHSVDIEAGKLAGFFAQRPRTQPC